MIIYVISNRTHAYDYKLTLQAQQEKYAFLFIYSIEFYQHENEYSLLHLYGARHL